ncbi:MAG: hydrogenase maturation nickel metallochaperone HypA [Candidatus Ranarchaeia archaeon]
MHEYAMTSDLLLIVLEESKKKNATKILEVIIQIGELSLLEPEQVKFCFEILTQDTIAEGAKLTIEDVKAEVKCSCGFQGKPPMIEGIYDHFVLPILKCPECGKSVKIIQGREFTLLRVKLVN